MRRFDRGGGRPPGGRAAGRPQGAGRAHHAGGPGPQRRRPRRRSAPSQLERRDDRRALQPRHAHLQQRDRPAAAGQDGVRRPAGLPARGHGQRRPKVRAMQIIDELEPHRRGPYGGAVGYVDFSGNMDTCIALRTMVIRGRHVYVQAGAGIVADSVPEKEREETVNKAMGLLPRLEIAEGQP